MHRDLRIWVRHIFYNYCCCVVESQRARELTFHHETRLKLAFGVSDNLALGHASDAEGSA